MSAPRPPRFTLWPPFLWLLAFCFVPFGIVLKISLSVSAIAQPPYRPQLGSPLDPAAWQDFLAGLDLENFRTLAGDDLYVRAGLSSLGMATLATAVLLVLGFPIALALARAARGWRALLLALVLVPFWTSLLIRVYAWTTILAADGLLNRALLAIGLIDEPVRLLNTNAAVLIGIVYGYLPFMILPVYASLEQQDGTLVEAASDLGASRLAAFWTVTAPLAWPGMVAGSLLCFIPIVGEFIIPDLLGGSDTLMLGRVLWSEFFSNRDWPLASAVAIVLTLLLLLPIVIFRQAEARRLEARR